MGQSGTAHRPQGETYVAADRALLQVLPELCELVGPLHVPAHREWQLRLSSRRSAAKEIGYRRALRNSSGGPYASWSLCTSVSTAWI